MVHCCVPSCFNRTEKGFKLFGVPQGERNKERRDIWIMNINRKELPANPFICEVHFEKDQFENNRQDGKRPLKRTAIPTLFDKKDYNKWKPRLAKKNVVKLDSDIKTEDKHDLIRSSAEETVKIEKNESTSHIELLKCRTCLRISHTDNSHLVKKLICGKRIKEVILMCAPELSSTLLDTEYICDSCYRFLYKLTLFINNCIDIEKKLSSGLISLEISENEVVDYDASEGHNNQNIQAPKKRGKLPKEATSVTTEIHGNSKKDPKENAITTIDMIIDTNDLNQIESIPIIRNEDDDSYLDDEMYNLMRCPSCFIDYQTYHGIKSHLEKFHEIFEEHTLKCESCKLSFNSFNDMVNHMSNHGHWCEPCNQLFNNKKELKEHKYCHQPQPHLCMRCCESFNDKQLLEKHLALHRLMSRIVERKSKIINDRLQCSYCMFKAKYPKCLQQHIDVVHRKQRKVECKTCSKKMASLDSLKMHMKLKHSSYSPFSCTICGMLFKRKDYVEKHEQCHLSNTAAFRSPEIMTYSEITNAAEKTFLCVLCDFKTESKDVLVSHLSVHKDRRKFGCKFCGLILSCQRTKNMHERIHQAKGSKFMCSTCWKKFQTEEELKVHENIHVHSIKRFVCCICKAAFSRQIQLETHLLDAHVQNLDDEEEATIDEEPVQTDDSDDYEEEIIIETEDDYDLIRLYQEMEDEDSNCTVDNFNNGSEESSSKIEEKI